METSLASEQRKSGRAGYAFGAFRFDPTPRTLLLADEPVRLGARAFDILGVLLEHAGTVVTADELMARVWPDVVVDETNLRVQIGILRKALARGEGPRAIETVSRGYRFTMPVSRWDRSRAEPALNEGAAHNLPALIATTVGRSETITLLADSLAEQRLVTITGPGGIGKTTVAIAVAQRCLPRFSHGICFVDFSALSDAKFMASTIASALGIGVLASDPLAGLRSHLRGKQVLLVLDTCEHVVESVSRLAEALLSHLPELRILATSREVLRATGEWAHRLRPLAPPPTTTHADGLTAADALAYPAVDLFVQRARAGAGRFELQDADAPIVAAICRRLDGMPLAIEFAAARVGELGLREIAARLDDRFDVLVQGRRTALPRHKTLAATLDWSYHLLPLEERAMLQKLSVFRGAFTADGAVAVAGMAVGQDQEAARSRALTYLSNLFAKSLVTADIGAEVPLYRLLDTTRAFATEKLAAVGDGQWEGAATRHAEYVLSALHAAELEWEGSDPKVWADRHRHLIDDLRGALQWATSETGDLAISAKLMADSSLLWISLSLLDEYGQRLESTFERLTNATVFIDPAISVRLWDVLGHTTFHTSGRMETVAIAFRASLEAAQRAGLVDEQLRALWGLHVCLTHNGDYWESLATLERFATLASKLEDPGVSLTYRRMAALVFHYSGDQAAARSHVERLLAHASSPTCKVRHRGVQHDVRAGARKMLALVLWLQGFPDHARERVLESVELSRSLGQAIPLCFSLAIGAIPIAFWTGDRATAEEYTASLLTCSLEHSMVMWQTYAESYQAILQGKVNPLPEPNVGAHLLEIMATMDASFASETVLARADEGRAGWSTPELLRIRASRILARGDAARDSEAEAVLKTSLEIARRQRALAWELRSATTLAELWIRRDRRAEAFALLSAVHGRFTEGFDTPDLVRAAAVLRDAS
ncbi:helix-turn-helix transcriptional regulator [Pendulispora rubella]|uniref:Helix-turn-helix transcriptional regulator n=1 Tax=Pendulispora rubella TaxID=2741070 RepID=A0ABZ2KY98_9BACT